MAIWFARRIICLHWFAIRNLAMSCLLGAQDTGVLGFLKHSPLQEASIKSNLGGLFLRLFFRHMSHFKGDTPWGTLEKLFFDLFCCHVGMI